MRKIVFVLGLALLLGGCGQKTGAPTAQKGAEPEKQGIFSSIKDAISKSISLKCNYKDEEGEVITVLIKGKALRVDSYQLKVNENEAPVTIHEIAKDDKLYIWSENSTEGWKIDLTKIKDDNSVTMGDKPVRSTDDIIAKVEEQKDNCKPESVADSMFELPSNITWTGDTAE